MSENEVIARLERLEIRTDKHIEGICSELKLINDKLTAIAISNAGRHECPQPGLCLNIAPRITELETRAHERDRDFAKLQNRVSWILGILFILSGLVTLFGPSIRHILNISS